MMITTERVAAGGKWLDTHQDAGWFNRVDLDQLDMVSGVACVLGQLYRGKAALIGYHNGYAYAVGQLGGIPEAGQLGFNCCGFDQDYEALTAAWKDYIVARRVAEQEPWVGVDDLAESLGQMLRGEVVPAVTLAEELAAV